MPGEGEHEQPIGPESELSRLLDGLRHGPNSPDAKAIAQRLVRSSDPAADEALLEFFHHVRGDPAVASVASRVVAERRPDRDPAYILDWFTVANNFDGPRFVKRLVAAQRYKFPWTSMFGVSRLRQAEPIKHYTKLLSDKSVANRVGAATALGDTADLAALDPLVTALGDPHMRVRVAAADAVRRLRHAGAGNVLGDHVIRRMLIKCLSGMWSRVAVAAARALGSMDDLEPVHQQFERTARWRRRRREGFRAVIRGEIPLLGPTWVGDDTT